MASLLRYGFELVYQPDFDNKTTSIHVNLQLIDQRGAPIALDVSSNFSYLMADVNPQHLFQLQVSFDKTVFVYDAE
jgi:hypothetical protein